MASQYQPAVSTRRRTASERRRTDALAAVALLLGIVPAVGGNAIASEVAALRPYTATYNTTALGVSLTLSRSLEAPEAGADRYILTNIGDLMVAGFHEISVFRVTNGQVSPESYVYRGTGLMKRHRELQFSAETGVIRSLHKDQWYELPYHKTTLDRMSQLEQLRLALLAGRAAPGPAAPGPAAPPDVLILRVADGKRVKDRKLVFVAAEALDTPLGQIGTLHFERLHDDPERQSHIWIAPGWDYLVVKTVHVENGKPVEMILTGATIAGAPVIVSQCLQGAAVCSGRSR